MSWIGPEFFTARELADIAGKARVPSFPATKNGAWRYAEREGWNALPPALARWRRGEGRPTREYHWSILPALMQAAIHAGSAHSVLVDAQAVQEATRTRQIAAVRAAGHSSRAHAVERARADVLASIEGYALAHQRSRAWGVARFLEAQAVLIGRQEALDAMTRGEILTPEAAAALGQPCKMSSTAGFGLDQAVLGLASDRKTSRISRSTLYAWFRTRGEMGAAGLSPVPPKEAEPIPPGFMAFLKFYARPSKPTIAVAHAEYLDAVATQSGSAPEPVTLSQARRILRVRLNNIEKHVGREGFLTLKARLAFVSRSTEGMWPTTIYSADGKTFDAEIADPVSRAPIKPEITSVLDVATRKCVGFAVSRKENVIAVTEGLRRACISHGIPAIFYTDRGPGYKNKTFDARAGETLGGMMGRLGITKMHALPYNSQAKGVVERFQAVWNDLARSLPTYLGHEMDKEASGRVHKATRRDLRAFGQSRILTPWPEFLAMCEAKIAEYNDRPHSGLPRYEDPETGTLRHMSPNEAWAAHVAQGFEPVAVDPADADDLFRPYEVRKVSRSLVRWNTNDYFHPDLEAWHDRQVAVGYDLHQADKVWVRAIDEKTAQPAGLICVAIFGGNTRRYVPLSFQQAAEEGRAKAQLRRLDRKAEAVHDQLRAPLLEHVRPVPMPDLSMAEMATSPRAAPRPIAGMSAAAITSDADLARLCLADPGQLTPGRARILNEVMARRNGRELLRISGVDLDELDTLLRSAA